MAAPIMAVTLSKGRFYSPLPRYSAHARAGFRPVGSEKKKLYNIEGVIYKTFCRRKYILFFNS